MIPFIENKDAITSANALMNMMSSVVQLSTWALGGILMESYRCEILIFICAST